MPSREEIVTFHDDGPPAGATPWVAGAAPEIGVEIVEPDPAWPARYTELATRIRAALGWRAINLEHVGSTAVPGLAAKPIIDIDLTIADPAEEPAYVPALEAVSIGCVSRGGTSTVPCVEVTRCATCTSSGTTARNW